VRSNNNRCDAKENLMTLLLFRDDPYRSELSATVTGVSDHGLVLDKTIFYPQGGGQPGDRGQLVDRHGRAITIVSTVYDRDRTTVLHQPQAGALLPEIGETVRLELDWPLRYKRMRVHTALHLLTAVLPYPVTGGAIGDGDGRLDFDIPDAGLDKAVIATRLNEMIQSNAEVIARWISDDELAANPSLVKTMSVQPPSGTGTVRLIEIVGLDLQPCGGTHVGKTAEIGLVRVTDIEKKGKQNRRVRIALGD
jgi:misacylated tRNA(Ala) deacylase